MRRRSLLTGGYDISEDDAQRRAAARSDDARDVRLGLDLLAGVVSPAAAVELRQQRATPIRKSACGHSCNSGHRGCRRPRRRRCARGRARALRRPDRPPRGCGRPRRTRGGRRRFGGTRHAPGGPRPDRAGAARDAVLPADAAEPEVVRRVVAAVEDPRTAGSASAAIRRLGDSAVPLLEEALARDDRPRRALFIRRRDRGEGARVGVVAPALDDPDRTIVLAALDALDAAGGGDVLPADVLARVFQDAAEHAARASAARSSLAEQHGPLGRALDDELDLARQLVITALALRHGNESGPPCGRGSRGRPAPGARNRGAGRPPLARRGRDRPPARAPRPRAWRAGRRGSAANARGVARRHHERSWPRLALVVARCVRTSRGSRLTAARRVRTSRRPGRVLDLLRTSYIVVGGRRRSLAPPHRQHAVRRRPARGRVARRARQAAADEPVPVGT